MAYATLMTPTDVSMSNGAVINITDIDGNPVAPIWSFTFQGDHLSWGQLDYYDVDTDELVTYAYFPSDGVWRGNERYNGDVIRIRDLVIRDVGVSGRNYKWLLRQYQNDLDTGLPLCNIRFGSGIIQSLPSGATGTTVEIDKGILKLRNPYYYTGNGLNILVGCAYIEVGHERRMITDYNKSTGIITLASGFSSGTLSVGALYRLYTNYIESGYYDFKIRDIPTITETAQVDNYGRLNLSGTYTHPNHVNLENYKYRIYSSQGEENYVNGVIGTITDDVDNSHIPIGTGITATLTGKRIIVATSTSQTTYPITTGYTGTITAYDSTTGIATLAQPLSGNLEAGFYYSIPTANQVLLDESDRIYNYYLNYGTYAYFWDRQLTIELETVTKEKQTTRKAIQYNVASSSTALPYTVTATQNQGNHTILLHTSAMNEADTNVYRRDDVNTTWQHIGHVKNGATFFTDWSAGNNHSYTYRLQRYNSAPLDVSIDTSFMGWTITALTPRLSVYQDNNYANRNNYFAGETWKFVAGASPSDISLEMGIVQHTGTSRFPTTSRSNNKFESGTFTAQLYSVDCPGATLRDDIEKVELWQKFISGDHPFLLKSYKGDVWIVNIVNAPTRQYEEGKPKIWTTVTYEWVQVDDIHKAYIF